MSESPEKREGGSASEDRAACPECGAENAMSADTCSDCGYQMHSSGSGEVRCAVAPLTHVDVRDASDSHGFWTMSGYAAVFNQTTTLFDGNLIRMTESIAPQAFNRVLAEQQLNEPSGVVHFNLGHDMNRSVAATDVPAGQPGSLQLRSDEHGLFFLAKVPSDDPDGVAMAAKMRSGVLRQASFAFTIANSDTTFEERENGPDIEHRTITEMKHLYDVCATPQGAYATTSAGLRSVLSALGQPMLGDQTHRAQPVEGERVEVSQDSLDTATRVVADEKRIAEFRAATAYARVRFPSRESE